MQFEANKIGVQWILLTECQQYWKFLAFAIEVWWNPKHWTHDKGLWFRQICSSREMWTSGRGSCSEAAFMNLISERPSHLLLEHRRMHALKIVIFRSHGGWTRDFRLATSMLMCPLLCHLCLGTRSLKHASGNFPIGCFQKEWFLPPQWFHQLFPIQIFRTYQIWSLPSSSVPGLFGRLDFY